MARPRDRRTSLFDVSWLLFFGALSAGWCVTAAQALSATFDEPTYLRLGLEHWRSGSSRALMKLGVMPLAVDLQTLPLFVWEKWRGLPVDPARDIAWILPWARTVTLAFWWTLLFYAWRAGRALSGPWAGRLAVAIIASEPVFLAHAGLATSDIAVTACLLAFFFEFRAQRDRSWPLRVALPGLLYGIAVLTKASALAFGVVGMLAIEVERRFASGTFRDWRQHLVAARPFLRDAVGIFAGGLVVTFAYCGSNAGEGLAEQIRHNLQGHGAYLLGREYRHSIWFYFPVALTIKTSLPLLLLPLVVASIQRRALWNWACLIALALFLFSLGSRVQIGVRLDASAPRLSRGGRGGGGPPRHALVGRALARSLDRSRGRGCGGERPGGGPRLAGSALLHQCGLGRDAHGVPPAQRFQLRLGARSARVSSNGGRSTGSRRWMSGISGSIRGRRFRLSG